MSIWKRIAAAPTGVLPDGLVTKVAIVAGAGVLAAIVLTTSLTGPADPPETVIEVPEAATATLQQRVEQAIATEARRAAEAEETAQRAAAASLEAQGRGAAIPTLPRTPVLTAGIVGLDPGGGAEDDTGPGPVGLTAAQTEAEIVLRETLRLEAIERQTRSLRTEPLVLTYRDMTGTGAVSAAVPAAPAAAAVPSLPLPPAQTTGGAGTLTDSIQAAGDFVSMLAQLDAAEQAAGRPLVTDLPDVAQAIQSAAAAGIVPGDLPGTDDTGPVITEGPGVPEGWDRITEGSFLEAVADTVSEADILSVYTQDPAAGQRAADAFRRRREAADRRVVLANTRADAAAALAEVVTDAETKTDGIATQNNVGATALQQAILAGTLTEGQLIAAMAELEAWDASARAAEDYDTEVRRRELEAEHQRVRTQPDIRHRRKADASTLYRRLISLDYVIQNMWHQWLPTEAEKLGAFGGAMGVERALLPQRIYGGALANRRAYFPIKMPIALLPDIPAYEFVYIDQGDATGDAVRSWGRDHADLWRALGQKNIQIQVAAVSPDVRSEERTRRIIEGWALPGNGAKRPVRIDSFHIWRSPRISGWEAV